MKSHKIYPSEFTIHDTFKDILRSKPNSLLLSSPLKFVLNFRDEKRGFEYEFERKPQDNERKPKNLCRYLNAYIKNYCIEHFKNEAYLEPFKTYKELLLISADDVAMLHDKIPQIFASYEIPVIKSPQTAASAEQDINAPSSNQYVFNLNYDVLPPVDYSEKLESHPQKINQMTEVDREMVDLMVQSFQVKQDLLGESLPQAVINLEGVKKSFQDLLRQQNETSASTHQSEKNEKNLEKIYDEFVSQNGFQNYKPVYTQLGFYKMYPKIGRKRKIDHENESESSLKKSK